MPRHTALLRAHGLRHIILEIEDLWPSSGLRHTCGGKVKALRQRWHNTHSSINNTTLGAKWPDIQHWNRQGQGTSDAKAEALTATRPPQFWSQLFLACWPSTSGLRHTILMLVAQLRHLRPQAQHS